MKTYALVSDEPAQESLGDRVVLFLVCLEIVDGEVIAAAELAEKLHSPSWAGMAGTRIAPPNIPALPCTVAFA